MSIFPFQLHLSGEPHESVKSSVITQYNKIKGVHGVEAFWV